MDTKLKKWKKTFSFIAFFLGISILLGNLSSLLVRYSSVEVLKKDVSSAFSGDYQTTDEFRYYVSDYLERFLVMASGGNISSWYNYYNGYTTDIYEGDIYSSYATTYTYNNLVPDDEDDDAVSRNLIDKLHEKLKDDKNVLYQIYHEGKLLYSNNDDLKLDKNGMLPEGYNFYLHFDGKQVTMIKDGEELDVYGDGYYRDERDWYVPGYKNFTLDEKSAKSEIVVAFAKEPKIYMYGNYSESGSIQRDNSLYWLKVSFDNSKSEYISQGLSIILGLILIVIYIILRKDKKAADKKIADLTGHVWFEIKLLIIILPFLLLLLSFKEYLYYYLNEIFYGYEYIEWDYLYYGLQRILEGRTYVLLVCFWLIYLVINDMRYNRGRWWHGICSHVYNIFKTSELRLPFQKRITNRYLPVFVAEVVLAAASLSAIIVAWRSYYEPISITTYALFFLLVAGLLIFFQLAYAKNNKMISQDVGALINQIEAVHNGDLTNTLRRPEDADLAKAVNELNDIQQGMFTAMNEQIKSERMKVELISNVSHDIKTPLTSIISYIELLKQEEELPDHVREYVAILDSKSQRLKEMVKDVFEISKAASGQLPVNIEELDLGKLLRQTLADMQEKIDESDIILRTEIMADPVMISADGQRLYRVFQNLIGNALLYSLPGSRVYVTLNTSGEMAVACVKNTSKTEIPSDLDFTERFVRGDESRTDGGSGLGLSIARSFTEACNGEFKVETNADLFTVTVSFKQVKE